MRLIFAALALAAAAAPAPAAPPAPLTRYDVPQDKGPQRVEQVVRGFAVGGESGWHTHPGVEIGYVMAGETEMRMADGTARRFTAGESFTIPRGAVHNGVNVGTVPAKLLVTYVIDRDAPARTAAAPPRGH